MGGCTSLRRFSSLISVMVPRISATNWKSYDYWNANTLFWFLVRLLKLKLEWTHFWKADFPIFLDINLVDFLFQFLPRHLQSPVLSPLYHCMSHIWYIIFSYILYHHCIDGKLDDFLFLHSNGLLDVWILNNVGSQSCFNQNKPSKHLSIFLLKLFGLMSSPQPQDFQTRWRAHPVLSGTFGEYYHPILSYILLYLTENF